VASPESAGLERLAARYELPTDAIRRLEVLRDLLVGDRLAPTAIKDPRRVLDDHLADSLVALELEVVRGAGTLIDLGSGAGLPGLPLAIALPRTHVTLIESSSRKCAFMDRTAAACALENVRVVHARAESWHEGLRGFDVAAARALASLEIVVEYAAPLLVLGGTLVAWRGARDLASEAAAGKAATILGMEPGPVLAVEPYRGARHRHLHLISKVRDTPSGFPRRAGMAEKRPLSALPVPS
jgi:16S rRNA (guanine527-N7)-methyltransferase